MPERKQRILVVDDKPEMAEMLADSLSDHGYEGLAASSSQRALAQVTDEPIDLLVTDLRMPGVDGLQLLEASRKVAPERPVIVMTAFGAIDSAVESIRRGAFHYLAKPFQLDELLVFVARALEDSKLRRTVRSAQRLHPAEVIGQSPRLRAALDVLQRVAPSDVPVLILGETGTGKGVFARALHAASPRRDGPLVVLNCAALPEHLLESELFGHVRGAFTGATSDRPGLFVEADGGTLLLDEIGELPLALQAKLLQVLESNAVRPVGATRERPVDVRIVAATHRDLRERARTGEFREDLLYRLDVVSIDLPPLRERPGDLAALVEHFLAGAKARHPTSPVLRFTPQALARLVEHRWPGNLRELAHLVERVVLLCLTADVSPADLSQTLRAPVPEQLFEGRIVPIVELERR